MTAATVTVLVATTADATRLPLLTRCLASIRLSATAPVAIIVATHGSGRDPAVLAWLAGQADVQLAHSEQPLAAHALLHARRLVATPYFATLDDDGQLLPGGTDLKRAAMEANPRADLVVSPWLETASGRERLVPTRLTGKSSQALETLFYTNWLQSGNALYRSTSISVTYFINFLAQDEWAWLAFRLALDKCRIVPIDAPTLRSERVLGAMEATQARLPLFQAMLKRQAPKDVERLIRRKMSAAWHDHARHAVDTGRRGDALAAHLRSLFLPDGRRYLGYSRALLGQLMRRPSPGSR